MKASETFLARLIHRPDVKHVLINLGTRGVIASTLEAAFDSSSRRRGLLGRDSLAENAALVIAPCNSVHTFFMRFAIDVMFVDRSGTVLKVRHAVPAWRMSGTLGAFAVIEMASGALRKTGTHARDVVTIVEASRELGFAGLL